MKLQDICVSLELAKELKKAGYAQDSLFSYRHSLPNNISQLVNTNNQLQDNKYFAKRNRPEIQRMFENENKFYSAPTVAELGEALPILVEDNYSDCYKSADGWECSYDHAMSGKFFTDKSEANARAKMWLYLKEEGLL